MKEKTINLENGFELVISGKYKEHYDYPRELLATFGSGGESRIFIRKRSKK